MSSSFIRRGVAVGMAPILATTLTFAAVSPASAQTGPSGADESTSADESSESSSESPLSSDENGDPTTSSQIVGLLGLTALFAIAPPAMASSMMEEGSSN